MERRYYSAASISHLVTWYETEHGISTATLLERHLADERVEGLSDYDRHVWLSLAREYDETPTRPDVSHEFRRGLVFA